MNKAIPIVRIMPALERNGVCADYHGCVHPSGSRPQRRRAAECLVMWSKGQKFTGREALRRWTRDRCDVKAERTRSGSLHCRERNYEEAPLSAVFTAECGFFSAARLRRLWTLPFPGLVLPFLLTFWCLPILFPGFAHRLWAAEADLSLVKSCISTEIILKPSGRSSGMGGGTIGRSSLHSVPRAHLSDGQPILSIGTTNVQNGRSTLVTSTRSYNQGYQPSLFTLATLQTVMRGGSIR